MDKPTVPIKIYRVRTSVGSQFFIKFIYAEDVAGLNGVTLKAGELHLQGHSVSSKKDISFCGAGFEPEVGGNIAVSVDGTNEEGYPIMRYELITRIESVEEVPTKGIKRPRLQ